MDLLEDIECHRFQNEDDERKATENVRSEVIKIVPENYKIAILPAHFIYTEGERIRRILVDQGQDFILNSQKRG